MRHVRATFLLGVGLFAYHVITRYGGDAPIGVWLRVFARAQASVFALMLCVVVADRITGGDTHRRAPYLIAIAVGAAAGTIFSWMIAFVADAFADHPQRLLRVLYIQIEYLVLGGAAVFVYLDRRRARAALARMHAAELERVASAKRTLEARLKAMQARVEPQFLFDTLAQVKRLYERDAELAERVLDELIAYLRAAMPRMRDTSSTVGQEIDLARAYLSIVHIGRSDGLDFSIDVPARAADARLPPMMLLPLVERAMVRDVNAATARSTLEIAAAVDDRRLRITIAGAGLGSDDAAIAGVRERLVALYGLGAQLTLRPRNAGGTEAVLEIPYEPVSEA